MKEIVVYILIAISDGSYNYGTVTTIAQFASLEKCNQTASQVSGNNRPNSVRAKCVKAEILVKND